MLKRIRRAIKQATCSHMRRRTTVTLHKHMLETSTRCKDCDKLVPPYTSFSEEWKHHHLMRGQSFAEGQTEVIFDA